MKQNLKKKNPRILYLRVFFPLSFFHFIHLSFNWTCVCVCNINVDHTHLNNRDKFESNKVKEGKKELEQTTNFIMLWRRWWLLLLCFHIVLNPSFKCTISSFIYFHINHTKLSLTFFLFLRWSLSFLLLPSSGIFLCCVWSINLYYSLFRSSFFKPYVFFRLYCCLSSMFIDWQL